jgi:hypothetical protein
MWVHRSEQKVTSTYTRIFFRIRKYGLRKAQFLRTLVTRPSFHKRDRATFLTSDVEKYVFPRVSRLIRTWPGIKFVVN